MTIYLILKLISTFPVIIGATGADAEMKFIDIKGQFEKNELLAADFPEICDPIIALDGAPAKAKKQTFNGKRTDFDWKAGYCTFPQIDKVPGTNKPSPYSRTAFTFRGLDGAIRGINIGGRRPDLALCDDLETRESADSDHQIGIRERLLDNDVGGLAGGGDSLPRIVLGTVQNNKCLTFKKLNEWGGRQYKAVNKWPSKKGMEKVDEYIEIRKAEKAKGSKTFDEARAFYNEHRKTIERGVEVGNPHCHSQKKLKDGTPVEVSAFQRVLNNAADKGWNYVHCELQNEPPDEKNVETLGLTSAKITTRISGYHQTVVPREAEVVAATIDLGKYACHWGIGAWRDGLIGNVVNYGVAEVHGTGTGVDKAQTDLAIRAALMQWHRELMGGELSTERPNIVLIDSGDFTDVVYSFVKEVSGGPVPFCAIKGLSPYRSYQNKPGKTVVGHHWHRNALKEKGIWLYNLDTDGLKGLTHQMWATPTFDEVQQFSPMSLSLFSSIDRETGQPDTRRHRAFSKHQVAEEYREEFKPGKGMIRKWHKLSPNNHWLDVMYMQVAAALMKGIKAPFEPEPLPAAPQNKRQTPGRNRFANKGKPFVAKRRA